MIIRIAIATFSPNIIYLLLLVGPEGIEPTTNGLKVRCATVAPRSYSKIIPEVSLDVNLIVHKFLECFFVVFHYLLYCFVGAAATCAAASRG